MTENAIRYSVLMSVYSGDKPRWVSVAINSMLNQTLPVSEFVVVIDGPISLELTKVLDDFTREDSRFVVVPLNVNRGLPNALNVGLKECSNEIVVRMDADDYSDPARCEKQIHALISENLDFVGTNVDEFSSDDLTPIAHVVLPESNEDILKMAKRRMPMRHPSLVFRKKILENVGGYDNTLLKAQDYDLVVRLLVAGFKCKNIQEPLVKMRVSPDFYKRRGGLKYFKKIQLVKKKLYQIGFYSKTDYAIGTSVHFVSCILPNAFRGFLYNKLLRNR